LYFVPNDIVVSTQNDIARAFVMRIAPKWEARESSYTLYCWAWNFHGDCYKRRSYELRVGPFENDFMALKDLTVYPILHVTQQTRDNLKSRGETAARLTVPLIASYTGPDFDNEESFVSFAMVLFSGGFANT